MIKFTKLTKHWDLLIETSDATFTILPKIEHYNNRFGKGITIQLFNFHIMFEHNKH